MSVYPEWNRAYERAARRADRWWWFRRRWPFGRRYVRMVGVDETGHGRAEVEVLYDRRTGQGEITRMSYREPRP